MLILLASGSSITAEDTPAEPDSNRHLQTTTTSEPDALQIRKLFRWNDNLIAEGRTRNKRYFWVVNPTENTAKPLKFDAEPAPLALATYQKKALVLGHGKEGYRLWSLSGQELISIALPLQVRQAKSIPILRASDSLIVLIADEALYCYRDGVWQNTKITRIDQRERLGTFNLATWEPFSPDVSLLVDDVLYLGQDRGEFGGSLCAINASSGQWQPVRKQGLRPSRVAVKDMKRSPKGEVWVASGSKHGSGRGIIHRFDGESWTMVGNTDEVTQPNKPRWSLAKACFTSIAFDDQGTLYVLGPWFGVVRLTNGQWEHLTPAWPAFASKQPSSIVILPDNKVVVALGEEGLWLCDFNAGMKQIPLELREAIPTQTKSDNTKAAKPRLPSH